MDKRVKRGLRAARPRYQDGGSLPFVSIPPDDLAKAQADPQRYERFFEPIAAGVKSLGDLVKAPFDMARDARQAGGYSQLNPTDVGRAGLNTGLGTLMPAVGGVGGRGGAVLMSGAGPTDKGIRAYHGSPHDFDKFDMSKIGTGEGAQAYGHGLYFAESEGVAKSYRENLSKGSAIADGATSPITFDALVDLGISRDVANQVMRSMHQNGFDKNATVDVLNRSKANYPSFSSRWNAYDDAAKMLGSIKGEVQKNPGRMYEVRIDADPEDFLDWDKPLSQQSEKVRGSIDPLVKAMAERYDVDRLDGESFVGAVANMHTPAGAKVADRVAATNALRKAGIPGIRYLDQGSRTAGEGSRNYVVFSDEIVQIVRKYGMAAAVSMYGADAVNDALQPMTGNDG